MHEKWTDRLSDYLDDELTPAERSAVDAHLRDCAECRAVLADLNRVVARARALEPRPPQADLWPGVAAAMGTGLRGNKPEPVSPNRGWRVSFTMPQALAASLVIALLSGAVAWQVAGRSAKSSRAIATPGATAAIGREPSAERTDAVTVSFADAQYDAAVADLEKALNEGRGRLDRTTVDIVEHNLQIIDQAIEQARQALEADPANSYLSGHLVEARRRKLDLLRRAAALTEGD